MNRNFKNFVLSLAFIFIILFSINESYSQNEKFNIPLYIQNSAMVDRLKEPVTSGIPIPQQANITDVRMLQIIANQNPVLLASSSFETNKLVDLHARETSVIPAQFKVLSRWGGTPDDGSKPIKWVLANVQVDVPAHGASIYYLRSEKKNAHKQTGIAVTEDDTYITVNTGKIEVRINKINFNFFDQVKIGSNDMISSSMENGIVVIDGDGTEYFTALDKPSEVAIEEQGSNKVVIKVKGAFKSESGSYLGKSHNPADYPRFSQPYPYIQYTVRFHFYNDKDYVRAFFTFENNGAYGKGTPENYFAPIQWLYFDDLSLNLNIKNLATTKEITLEDFSASISNESFYLYQDHKNINQEETNNFFYDVFLDNTKAKSDKRSSGWIDINDGSEGVTVAVRHFWQNYPKKIEFQNNKIKLGLWPHEGKYPDNVATTGYEPPNAKPDTYQFEGGRHKTYEMLFRFYAGAKDLTETINIVNSFKNPLFMRAAPDWYASTKALGMIAPSDMTHSDPEINEAIQRFERIQRTKVYAEDADPHPHGAYPATSIYTERELRIRENLDYYGWFNFGDLGWAKSYCSLHYDWSYSMLLHYIRTGKRKFLEMGEEMARHRYDIDQYHGDRLDLKGNNHIWNNFLQRYESGYHGDLAQYPNMEDTPKQSHTWNGGLVLYYLLTGDKLALDAAEEVGKAAFNNNSQFFSEKGGSYEIRHQGWSLLNLLNLYRVNGDGSYLNLARAIGKNSLLYLEQQSGGLGYWGGGYATQDTSYQHMVQFGYVTEPLIYLHYYSQDQEILDLLIRMANWLKDKCLFGGYSQQGQYMPLQTPYTWYRDKAPTNGEIVRLWFLADLMAYVYQKTENQLYLDLARQMFRDTCFWLQGAGETFYDPASRSRISYVLSQYPGTETKIHGWTGRGHQIYLYTEWLTTGIQDNNKDHWVTSPSEFILYQNYPNPFNNSTSIGFEIPFSASSETVSTTLKIYNSKGQLVHTLLDEKIKSGHYTKKWNGKDMNGNSLASGTYVYVLKAGDIKLSKKLILLK